jgi:hypothetical protein
MKRFIGLMFMGLLMVGGAATLPACGGDDEPPPVDAMVPPDVDTTPDAGADASIPLTFEAYVIDLVENRTAGDTDPAPFTEFSTLPESGDPAAFDPLFP